MRTKNSLKNLFFSFFGQMFGILISFFARLIFIRFLGSEYLGLNGLFTNILTMLSLFELGVGTAINFSLYAPLSKNDIETVKSLMYLYKKSYCVIGCVILIIGCFITPFLSFFIDEMPNIPYISLIYILFVVNTSCSYFFSYKRSLLISDQKRYIATFYRYLFYFFLNLSQIVILWITKNYILFLVIQIIFTLFENVCISFKANKMYPFLNEKNILPLSSSNKKVIIKNTYAMIMHKVGGIVVSATDNIIISKYVGLLYVGLYSNYYLVTNALNTIISQIFNSIIASVGNFAVTESKNKLVSLFYKVFFLNFWIYSVISICLFILFNDFVSLWLGKEFILNNEVVVVIIINFFVTGMRKTVLTFKEALGLYWQDKYKAVFEAVINLFFSILLVKKVGLVGVFIGTFLSTMLTCFFVEPYVLYKYGLKEKMGNYFKKYFLYVSLFILSFGITFICINHLFCTLNIYIFVLKGLLSLIIPNILMIFCFFKTEEFIYFYKMVKKYLYLFKNKYSVKK